MSVYLVYGSPCSGKSTYIKEHMQRGDLVCDVDLIYGSISGNEAHDTELYTHEVACELTHTLKDIIRNRKGNWRDAYVVSLANTSEYLMAEMERVKADECIFMDTPYEVCMERAKERPLVFQLLVNQWFVTKEETINVQCYHRQAED